MAAIKEIGHPFMIQPQQVKDGGVRVVAGGDLFFGLLTNLVGGADLLAALDPGPGHTPIKQARLGVTWNDGWTFFSALQDRLKPTQIETGHLNRLAMALDALLVQDGKNPLSRG
jgi:hypothetical protein